MHFSTIKRFTVLLCLLCAMVTFVSCDKKEDSPKTTTTKVSAKDEAEIKSLVQNFWDQMCAGDLVAMQKIMTKESKDAVDKEFGLVGLSTDERAAAMTMAKGLFQEMMKDATMELGKVTINGDKAEIKVSSVINGEKENESIELVKEDGAWKVIFDM